MNKQSIPVDSSTTNRTWVVSQTHAQADDRGPGTPSQPFQTIAPAAAQARPGDTVLIHAGIYRERVAPARGGEPERPIKYMAAPGEQVSLRGSEIFTPDWQPVARMQGVWRGSLESVPYGQQAYRQQCDPVLYSQYRPWREHFNRGKIARPQQAVISEQKKRLAELTEEHSRIDPMDIAFAGIEKKRMSAEQELAQFNHHDQRLRRHLKTVGQIFINGRPMTEVETLGELQETPGAWMIDAEGAAVILHSPDGGKPPAGPVEISVRHTVFAPLQRGLGYLHLDGLIIEHAANHFPTWGREGWTQIGALSCRSGHHWTVQNCIIRLAKGLGIDCGSEGGGEKHMEFPEAEQNPQSGHGKLNERARQVGFHLFRHNQITDNGHCGIAGIGHTGTRLLGNLIARNNRDGWTSPWWEFGGVKFHFFFDGLIEGNLIIDNEAHGIWIDNQWRGSRITGNLILNNLYSGINVELGRGPVLIDNNVIAHTRQGDGVYGHDCADITIAHNLLYANANFGAWFAYATPRVKPEDGCHDIRVLNNLILGNRAGALGLPLPWDCADRNLANHNLLMGGGSCLDEGSGPQPPQFQLTNATHCGSMQHVLGDQLTAQTPEVVWNSFTRALREAGVPNEKHPRKEDFLQDFKVGLELWRAATGNDRDSQVISTIRDGLLGRPPRWKFDMPEELAAISCKPVDGVDRDYRSQPVDQRNPRPGPWQELMPGSILRQLWPRGSDRNAPNPYY